MEDRTADEAIGKGAKNHLSHERKTIHLLLNLWRKVRTVQCTIGCYGHRREKK